MRTGLGCFLPDVAIGALLRGAGGVKSGRGWGSELEVEQSHFISLKYPRICATDGGRLTK